MRNNFVGSPYFLYMNEQEENSQKRVAIGRVASQMRRSGQINWKEAEIRKLLRAEGVTRMTQEDWNYLANLCK